MKKKYKIRAWTVTPMVPGYVMEEVKYASTTIGLAIKIFLMRLNYDYVEVTQIHG